jgi:hypothetical protein
MMPQELPITINMTTIIIDAIRYHVSRVINYVPRVMP